MIAGALCATRAGYAEGRKCLDALLHEMNMAEGAEYRAVENPAGLPGRSAEVLRDGVKFAEVFEVHPEVLENWKLGHPVVMFSLTLGEVEYHV